MPSINQQQHTQKGFMAYHPYARQIPPSQSKQPYGKPNGMAYDSNRAVTDSNLGAIAPATSPGPVQPLAAGPGTFGGLKKRALSDSQNSDKEGDFVPEGEGDNVRDNSFSPNANYAPLWDSSPVDLERVQRDLVEFKAFLLTAPALFVHNDIIRRFKLPNGEQISCVRWSDIFFVTGTDIVRCLTYRFHAFGRRIINKKKFEEGIFSDLRNLKCNTDATLETPKSPFLHFLYKHQCVRTKKKQKVFFWYSVRHERLFIDALERDLKKEVPGSEQGAEQPTTRAVSEPALSFSYDPQYPLQDQIGNAVKMLPTPLAAVVDASMGKHQLDQSGAINCESPDQKLFQSKTVLVDRGAFANRSNNISHSAQLNGGTTTSRLLGSHQGQDPRQYMALNGGAPVPYSVGLSRAQQLVQAQVQAQVHAQLAEARAEGAEGAESVLEAAKAQQGANSAQQQTQNLNQQSSQTANQTPPQSLTQAQTHNQSQQTQSKPLDRLYPQAYSQQQQYMAPPPPHPMSMCDRPLHPYSQYSGGNYNGNMGYMAAPHYGHGPGYQGNPGMQRGLMYSTPTRSFFEDPSSQFSYNVYPGYNVMPGYPSYSPFQTSTNLNSYPGYGLGGGVLGGGAAPAGVTPSNSGNTGANCGQHDAQRRAPASLKLELDEIDINSDFPLDFLRREDIRLGNTPTFTQFPTEDQAETAGGW